VVVLDASAMLAIGDARDERHRAAIEALTADADPAVVPVAILAEIDSMFLVRVGPEAMLEVLGACADGTLLLDCGDVDPPRIEELMRRYADLALGFADAAVIACAERSGGAIMTFDRRDFEVVAADVPITIVP
jgi:uncharacterized protein